MKADHNADPDKLSSKGDGVESKHPDNSPFRQLLEDPELLEFRRAYLEQQNFELSRRFPQLLQHLRQTVTSSGKTARD